MRDVIKKGTTPDQIYKAFKWAKYDGIRTLANIMIGLPTETMDDLDKTEKLVRTIKPDVTVVSIATPLPGTELYEMVGVNIAPSQYAALNWNGSEMTLFLNKSEIKNIVSVHHALKRYVMLSFVKALLHWKDWCGFLSRNDRWRRFKVVLAFLAVQLRR